MRGGPGEVVQARLRGGRAAEVATASGGTRRRGQRTTSSSPSRTRRRHSTRHGLGVQPEVVGGEHRRGSGARSTASVIRAGTVIRRSPSSRCSRSPSGRSTHGLPGRRRSRVSAVISSSCIRSTRRPRRWALRFSRKLPGLRRRRARQRRRRSTRREPAAAGRPAPRPAGRVPRGSRPGRWASASTSPIARLTARSSRVRQVSWLMPIVTCSDTVSCARAACGVPVGRYMLSPGSSSTSRTSPPRHPVPGGPPTASSRGSGRRRRRGCRCARRSPASPGGVR